MTLTTIVSLVISIFVSSWFSLFAMSKIKPAEHKQKSQPVSTEYAILFVPIFLTSCYVFNMLLKLLF